MNLDELEEALVDLIGDNFSIDFDSEGQLIIYTGLCEAEDGELEEHESDEDLEEDPDVDPDLESYDEDEDD